MIREYGNLLVVSTSTTDALHRNRVIQNYRTTKERAFPTWPGKPEYVWDGEITLPTGVTVLGSGWRADIPEEYVQ